LNFGKDMATIGMHKTNTKPNNHIVTVSYIELLFGLVLILGMPPLLLTNAQRTSQIV